MHLNQDYFNEVEDRDISLINWKIFASNLAFGDVKNIQRTLNRIYRLVRDGRLSMSDEVMPVYIKIAESLPAQLENQDLSLFNMLILNAARIAAEADYLPLLYQEMMFGSADFKVKRFFCMALISYGSDFHPRSTDYLFELAYKVTRVYMFSQDGTYLDMLLIMNEQIGYILHRCVEVMMKSYSRSSSRRAILVDLYETLTMEI